MSHSLAATAEDHLDVVDGEVAAVTSRHAQAVELDGQVAHPAARRAHEVVVVVLDVRVDPQRAGAEVEHVHLAERLEVVDGLVHGLQRDRRHVGPGPVVERLDRRVRVVALEQAEDRLALRRDAQPALRNSSVSSVAASS